MMWWSIIGALHNARSKAFLREAHDLNDALQNYKAQRLGLFPPSFADATTKDGGLLVSRQYRLVWHLRMTFPEVRLTPLYQKFDDLRNFVLANYAAQAGDGKIVQLDLNDLDQAEALVFWLAGFPTPVDVNTGQPLSPSKLFGFNKKGSHPFQLDVPPGAKPDDAQNTRWFPEQAYGFAFEQSRLRDADNDGWWEYVPAYPSDAFPEPCPPYVYFDAGAYNPPQRDPQALSSYLGYPRPDPQRAAQPAALRARWGLAVPVAKRVNAPDAKPPIEWINGDSLQIISAGLDGRYSDPSRAEGQLAQPRIPMLPSGNVIYPGEGRKEMPLDSFERDNVSNFSELP